MLYINDRERLIRQYMILAERRDTLPIGTDEYSYYTSIINLIYNPIVLDDVHLYIDTTSIDETP